MKSRKENFVISVESELGCNGEKIARELAKAVGVKCYSGKIIKEASKLSGISENLLRRYEEKPVREAYDLMAENEGKIKLPQARRFIMAQLAACRALAERGSCVLVNHHSNMAMCDHEKHFSVFVHSDWESRVDEYARENKLDKERAAKELASKSRARRRYFRSIAKRWGEAGNYDLTIDSTNIAPAVAAGNIVSYLETVSQEVLRPHPTQAQKRGA